MDIRPIASGSSGNAYWISDGKTPLLLDAGIPMKAIQIGCGFRVRELGGCFITHCHGDHSKAAKDLLRYGVDVYTARAPQKPAAWKVTGCTLRGRLNS